MAEEPRQDEATQEGEAASTFNRDFAGVLRSIMDSASEMFPSPEETEIRFSVALVGEMGRERFADLINELPVVAGINLRKEIGTKAALLTDVQTASALVGFVSEGKPSAKESLTDDDLVVLYDALSPILDALANACEEATGHPLGAIEKVEVVDPADPPPMFEELSNELSEKLCRATASVTIGNDESGRLVIVLPRDLAKALTRPAPKPADASVSPSEEAELQQEDPGPAVSEHEEAELQRDEIDAILSGPGQGQDLPSQDEIDALLAQATGEPAPATAAPVAAAPPPPAPRPPSADLEASTENIDLILDIPLRLTARLGQMEMSVGEIMKLSPGSVIDIDRFVDEPIELVVNDRLIARGDIVVVQENFGIKISEIVSPRERIQSLR